MNKESIVTRSEVFGFAHPKEFDVNYVRDLRVDARVCDPRHIWRYFGIRGGSIVFDYRGKTYRFGDSLEEAEAKVIVATVGQRFPRLASLNRS